MKTLILQCTLFLSILFCLLFITYGQTQAAEPEDDGWEAIPEYFECKPQDGSWDNIIATLVKWDNETNGTVTLTGKTYFAGYNVSGFFRVWSYGEIKENDKHSYSILMELDGKTIFYDYRKESKNVYPAMTAQCRKTK